VEQHEMNPATPLRGRSQRANIIEREDHLMAGVQDYIDNKYNTKIHFLVCVQKHLATDF
jgi:hypothetical protein